MSPVYRIKANNTVWLLLILSACSALPPALSPVAAPSMAPKAQVEVHRQILQSPETFGLAARQEKQKALHSKKTQQEQETRSLVERLEQQAERGVLDLLGGPQRRIREGQMLIWQYLTERCQWDIYFREDGRPGSNNLYDMIIHHQGRILTDPGEITDCEASLQQS